MEKIEFKKCEVGIDVSGLTMVASIEERMDKNNKPYVVLGFVDGEQTANSAPMWGTTASDIEYKAGDIVAVTLNVTSYNDVKQFNVVSIAKSKEGKKEDFILSSPIPTSEMLDTLTKEIKKFKNIELKKILLAVLKQQRESLLKWSAAKLVHHNYYGGLLYHSYTMYRDAKAIAPFYPFIDKEMLLAGCVLHDIGKLCELTTDDFGVAEFTDRGTLLGHSYLGAVYIDRVGRALKTPDELLMCLEHMICSHSGSPEWGAIVRPSTKEALLLHLIDLLDSQMEQMRNLYNGVAEGEFTPRNPYMDKRMFYKAHASEEIKVVEEKEG